jgi:hypothetical protein
MDAVPVAAVTFRRRPIPRSSYRWSPSPKPANVLRFELIQGGAVRKYPDGREVCQDNALGRRIYKQRVSEMVQRQNFRCSLCKRRLGASEATFEHHRRRGLGGAFREDRIIDEKRNWLNSASHWVCNVKRG